MTCGLMVSTPTHRMGINLHLVDASDLFLGKLAGVTDPETKRKIIGNTFIEVFDEVRHWPSTACLLAPSRKTCSGGGLTTPCAASPW